MAKGSWRGGSAPAQGKAMMPTKSKAATGEGFKFGIKNMACPSRTASPMPPNIANKTGYGMEPKGSPWGSGAEKPGVV